MVMQVSVGRRAGQRRGWRHRYPVRVFLHRRAELSAPCHGDDAVRFPHPPVGDAANARRALGEKCYHPEGHGRIGDRVEVYVYPQRALPFRASPAAGHGSGRGETSRKAISLHVPAHAGHAYRLPARAPRARK